MTESDFWFWGFTICVPTVLGLGMVAFVYWRERVFERRFMQPIEEAAGLFEERR